MARIGQAWPSLVRPGQAWPSLAKPGQSWSGLAMRGWSWPSLARTGQAWLSLARPGQARSGPTWQGLARPSKAWRDLAEPGQAWPSFVQLPYKNHQKHSPLFSPMLTLCLLVSAQTLSVLSAWSSAGAFSPSPQYRSPPGYHVYVLVDDLSVELKQKEGDNLFPRCNGIVEPTVRFKDGLLLAR